MIVHHVTRDKHGKDLHHVLKYADLEGCAWAPDVRKSYFHIDFLADPVVEQPDWRRGPPPRADWYELLNLHFHPQPERVMPATDMPWADVTDPVVLFGRVPTVPREISTWLPQLRTFIAQVVADRVRILAPKGLPTGRWTLHVALLPESSTLEIGLQTWTDLRRNDETIERISVP